MENPDETLEDEFSNILNLLSRAFLEKSRLLRKFLILNTLQIFSGK